MNDYYISARRLESISYRVNLGVITNEGKIYHRVSGKGLFPTMLRKAMVRRILNRDVQYSGFLFKHVCFTSNALSTLGGGGTQTAIASWARGRPPLNDALFQVANLSGAPATKAYPCTPL
jgi:hypothetical protein